jgi:hypothetical protein
MLLNLDLKKYGTTGVNWILAHGKVQWWTHVKAIMNLLGAENSEIPLQYKRLSPSQKEPSSAASVS